MIVDLPEAPRGALVATPWGYFPLRYASRGKSGRLCYTVSTPTGCRSFAAEEENIVVGGAERMPKRKEKTPDPQQEKVSKKVSACCGASLVAVQEWSFLYYGTPGSGEFTRDETSGELIDEYMACVACGSPQEG